MDATERTAVGYALLAVTLLAAGGAAALILSGLPEPAAGATAVAAAGFTLSGRRAKYAGRLRLAFADSALERAVDAVVLGSVAWAGIEAQPVTSAAALSALVLGYLGAYIRAKATGLGFPVQESLIARGIRAGLIVAGLAIPDALQVALWLASAVSLFSVIRQVAEVARMREAA